MNGTQTALPTRSPERDLPQEPREDERATQPAPDGRWWFVFDRWLAVPESAQDEFVMA